MNNPAFVVVFLSLIILMLMKFRYVELCTISTHVYIITNLTALRERIYTIGASTTSRKEAKTTLKSNHIFYYI